MTPRGKVVRHQIADVAADMVQKKVELLEGCRTIVRLRASLSEPDLSDADLLVLVAVESELEDVPLGAERQKWARDALNEKDWQTAEYLRVARQEILRACHALMKRWG